MHGSILAVTLGFAYFFIIKLHISLPPGHIEKGVSFGRSVGARKLKNGAGDGENIHVFNIKPCVFPAKFRTPSCQTARRACRLGTKPLAYRAFLLISVSTHRDQTINTIPYTRAVLCRVARGLLGGDGHNRN